MSIIARIAKEEWRLMLRERVALIGLLLLAVLTITASFSAWEFRQTANADRTRYQAQANQEFEAQPDRHPHRMVHYGHFVFRPLNPLAAFDTGIDAYTGHTLFLEGHRQNSANFGDIRQSSLLLRFGQLTPAFVLQVLAPLLLIFIGHAAVARERESGTLRVLLAQGVKARQIILGKLLALTGVAALALLPAAMALLWMSVGADTSVILAAAMLAGYTGWLLLWAMVIVWFSSLFPRRRDALLGLLAAWAVIVILVPRLASDAAASTHVLPTRFESDIAVARDLARMGDSHNPDDPYFVEFRKKILTQYGASKVEELPVNYKGLLGIEGERMTSELFDRYATASFDQQARQSQWMDASSLLSPAIALRRLSMTMAGTNLDSYRRFLEQGEHYRYTLIQSLNKLQAEKIRYTDDRDPTKQNRVGRTNWHDQKGFQYQATSQSTTFRNAAPAAITLIAWLIAIAALLFLAGQNLGKTKQ